MRQPFRKRRRVPPLVNDVWPVVVRRIYDNEPNVVLTAMNALSVVFRHAGDFVSTRVE